jgi:hypothetical protein
MDTKRTYNIDSYEDFSIWNIRSVMDYFKDNIAKLFLLVMVFVIVYVVDYLNNLNSMVALQTTIPGLNNITQQIKGHEKLKKRIKKTR